MSSAVASTTAVPVATPEIQEHLSPNQQAWRRFRRNHPAVISSVFVGVLVLLVLIWPVWRAPALAKSLPRALTFSPIELSDAAFSAPSALHWLGTDANGR